jgi:putative endonuclease
MRSNVETGKIGEDSAADYFASKGYRLLARNYRTRYGEIDIICENQNSVVFAEIKNIPSVGIEGIEYLVDRRKRNRIINTSKRYLFTSGLYGKKNVRYDVVVINDGSIEHFEGAFYEGGIG